MTVSVIIITLSRPDYIRRCLECLLAQVPELCQIIVVDSSPDDLTLRVTKCFNSVLYLRNEYGAGHMTTSRNIGLKAAEGNIIAFLDDDAFAHPGWCANLIATYTDLTIGAVGGRVLNNQPGESERGVYEIGRLKHNGTLTANFAANPGTIVEVDHLMGCNMSYRREVLARLGGFREDYPGISGLREDTDMCLRVKRLGYHLLFNPAVCVDHIGAPQAIGQRFDVRYAYYGARNHLCMLVRNFGIADAIIWRYLGSQVGIISAEFVHRIAGAFARLSAMTLGIGVGAMSGIALLIRGGRSPVRTDRAGQAISAALQARHPITTGGTDDAPLEGSPELATGRPHQGALEE